MKMFLAGFLWNHWFWVTIILFTDWLSFGECSRLTDPINKRKGSLPVIPMQPNQSDINQPSDQPIYQPSGQPEQVYSHQYDQQPSGQTDLNSSDLKETNSNKKLNVHEKSDQVEQKINKNSGDSPSMKIGSNADDLTVIENLRAVLQKSTKDMSKDSTEGSGDVEEGEGSGERKSKSIDQLSVVIVKPEEISFLFPSSIKKPLRETYIDPPDLPEPMVSGSFTPRWYYSPRAVTLPTTSDRIKSRVMSESIFREQGGQKEETFESISETEFSSIRNVKRIERIDSSDSIIEREHLINEELLPMSDHKYLSEIERVQEHEESSGGSLEYFHESSSERIYKSQETAPGQYEYPEPESSSERSNIIGASMSTLGLLYADSDSVTTKHISTMPTKDKRSGNNVPHISHHNHNNKEKVGGDSESVEEVEEGEHKHLEEKGDLRSETDLANSTVNTRGYHLSDSKSEDILYASSESDIGSNNESVMSDDDSDNVDATELADDSITHDEPDAENLNLQHQHPDKNERLVESVEQETFNHSRPEEGRSLGLEEGRSLGLEEGRSFGLEEGRSLGLEMARSARLPNHFLKQVHGSESSSPGGDLSLQSLQVKRSSSTFYLDVSSVIGIAMGLISFLILLTGIAGALIYRKHIKEKNQGERFSNFDSSSMGDSDTFNSISYADCAGIDVHRDNSSEELYSLDNDSFLNSLEAMTFPENWTSNHTNL